MSAASPEPPPPRSTVRPPGSAPRADEAAPRAALASGQTGGAAQAAARAACALEDGAPAPAAGPAAGALAPRRGEEPRPAPPWAAAIFRWVRAIGIVLVVIDVVALSVLLYKLGFPTNWAIGLAILTGGFGTYQAQYAHLLSRGAFLVHRSPGRHLLMAILVLAGNVGGLWLIRHGLFTSYALARLLLAMVVVWAWGQTVGPRLLGDGNGRRVRRAPIAADERAV